jgi:hypothetical protein
MRNRANSGIVFVLALALGVGVASAQEPTQPTPSAPSTEQRHAMAEIHQKMADCLNSQRPIDECRSEMRSNCQAMMGERGCPMMMGMGPGTMGGGMMPRAPKPPGSGN